MRTGRSTSPASAIELRGVSAGYGGRRVVTELTCTVAPGELVGVVGPSGAGKTTLLRLLTGQAEVQAGAARVFGEPVRAGSAPPRIGYVPQVEGVDWDFPLHVEQAVLLGLTAESRRLPWFSRAEHTRARTLLERLGLAGLERRHIRELSGGQQQRMFLARAMIRDCDLILLDEPTGSVDLGTRREILQLLAELADAGIAVVLTTHDLNWVAAHLPRIICMNTSITADGRPTDVLTEQVVEETYGARVRIVRDGDLVVIGDRDPLLGDPATPREDAGR